jgi:hypothetical protein
MLLFSLYKTNSELQKIKDTHFIMLPSRENSTGLALLAAMACSRIGSSMSVRFFYLNHLSSNDCMYQL